MTIRPRSLRDVALTGVAALLAILVSSTVSDADLWGHLRFGADVLRTGHLTAHDPYSFTSDIAWINHEWLSEVILAAVYGPLGAAGLNLLKIAIIGGIAALTWRMAARSGARAFSAAVLTALIVVSTYTRTQSLRPQLFSVLLFAVLMELMDRMERDGRSRWLAIAFLFCCWANIHGGWIVGLGAFGLWSLFDRRRLKLLAVAAGATLINPYGFGLWRFLYDTVGLARPDISDWKPLFALPGAIIGLELALPALAAVSVLRTRTVPPLSRMGIIAILAFSTYRVGRTDAFMQIAIAWTCAPAILAWTNRVEIGSAPTGRMAAPRLLNGYVAAAMLLGACGFAATRMSRITIDGDWKPDTRAAAFLEQRVADSRVLTWFDWGEYAIWHLADSGVRVSMDGRRETIYSTRVIQDHFAFYSNATPDAWRYPDTIGADHIWIPRRLPIVPVLERHGWHELFSTDQSVVLSRSTTTPFAQPLVASFAFP